MDLHGKTAVITGASRGIGAGLAQACVGHGMNVAICARTTPKLNGDKVLSATCDVANEHDVKRFAQAALERFGSIDLWVNNAGVLEPMKPIRDYESEELLHHMGINFMGVFHGSREFARHVRSRPGEGVLINISSGAAVHAYAGWGAYCAGKAAVDRLTEVLQLEEAEAGMHAFAIAPGIIDTRMQEQIRASSPELFPDIDKFLELKATDAFSSAEFVAERLLEVAFVPGRRPESVVHRLPPEK
jgi:NAD(P)-dependent dehydrogenase (short-subunit alcohol dehydrogenase family)